VDARDPAYPLLLSLSLPQKLLPAFMRGVGGMGGNDERVAELLFNEIPDDTLTPVFPRLGGPVLLPMVERRRGRFVGATAAVEGGRRVLFLCFKNGGAS